VNISGETLTIGSVFFLLLALGLALAFEFVNGFHDTANAVATVIYTHTLRPNVAVVWSGCWNLIGVLTSTGAIAFSVVALLPVELVINAGSGPGFAMVFALLISAILWNLGTWYLGLPASSSHTLIGSIIGVGLGYMLMACGKGLGQGVNWAQASEVGLSLLVSPIIGFCCAALLLLLSKAVIKRKELYSPPDPKKAPPFWIRCILFLTCTGVSFAHGSNDGQKGMGLIMLIMIGIMPGTYALNLNADAKAVDRLVSASRQVEAVMERRAAGMRMELDAARDEVAVCLRERHANERTAAAVVAISSGLVTLLDGKKSFREIAADHRRNIRRDVYLIAETIGTLDKSRDPAFEADMGSLRSDRAEMLGVTRFIPTWVKVAVAFALGIGTMIGWKRIVVTVGEKIGKQHLTYAQGAAAELVAMGTIGVSDYLGMPVSTTHVLSSGVAGTMAANHSGLQMNTLRNLLMAWVLTLPVCTFLGAMTFALGDYVVLRVLGVG
jgi:PiT family inorganic phosphate transporter